jgi:hypothetical protein
MIADASFTGIMSELAQGRPGIQGLHSAATQGSETHGRDVENAGVVWLQTSRTSDPDAQGLDIHMRGKQSMMQALKAGCIHIMTRTKGNRIALILCATINEGTFLTIDRRPVDFGFDKVLIYLRPYGFEKVTEMTDDGKIAPNRMTRLSQIINRHDQNKKQRQKSPPNGGKGYRSCDGDHSKRNDPTHLKTHDCSVQTGNEFILLMKFCWSPQGAWRFPGWKIRASWA